MVADVSRPKDSTEGGAGHFSLVLVIMCAYVCNTPGTLYPYVLPTYPGILLIRGQRAVGEEEIQGQSWSRDLTRSLGANAMGSKKKMGRQVPSSSEN